MALIYCPECQHQVSTEAMACPQCAFPTPGRKAQPEGSNAFSFISCTDCGSRISKNALMCPHCGAPPNLSLVEQDIPVSTELPQVGQDVTEEKIESTEENPEIPQEISEVLTERPAVHEENTEQFQETLEIPQEKAKVETHKTAVQEQSWICSHCGLPLPNRGKENNTQGYCVEETKQYVVSNKMGNGENPQAKVASVSTQELLDTPIAELEEKTEDIRLPLPPRRQDWEEPESQPPKQRSTIEDQAEIVKFLYGDEGSSLAQERRSLERQATSKGRKMSPLWEEVKLAHQEASLKPPRRKKWALVLLLFIGLLVAGGWAAVWQLGNLNGLEALVYWHL